MSKDWTEAEIAAFVDGELDATRAQRLAAIIETDPEARALAERLTRANALLREAFDAPMHEPPPDALVAAIKGSPTIAGAPPRRRRPTWFPAALAAGIALIIGVGVGVGGAVFSTGDRPIDRGLAVGPAPETVRTVLETAPSGTTRSDLRPVASFEVAGGGICREFETLDAAGAPATAGLACRSPEGGWTVLLIAVIADDQAAASEDYVPAAGIAGDSLAVALDAIGAAAALSPEEEAARIAAGWR